MKRIIILLTIMIVFSFQSISQSEILSLPSKGKSCVYFVRISNYAYSANFKFYHDNNFIGDFYGKNYLRYECDSGKGLFLATSRNVEYLTVDMKEGCTYVVIVDVIPLIFTSAVRLQPITESDSVKFSRAMEIVLSREPSRPSQSYIDKVNKRKRKEIDQKFDDYNIWKKSKDFRHVSPDMSIICDIHDDE